MVDLIMILYYSSHVKYIHFQFKIKNIKKELTKYNTKLYNNNKA